MRYRDYWIPFFGITLAVYTHSGKTWRIHCKPFEMPDSEVGSYNIWFVINTPFVNFCISNYLQKLKQVERT